MNQSYKSQSDTHSPNSVLSPQLIADIGGTHARFALYRQGRLDESSIQVLACHDFDTLESAVRQYLSRQNATVESACMALAGPVGDPVGDLVNITNNHWAFDCAEMQHALNLSSFKVINDFTAQALAIPALTSDALIPIGTNPPIYQHNAHTVQTTRLIIGPGTGLGIAGLKNVNGHWLPLPGEGGHGTFAAVTQQDMDILNSVRSDDLHPNSDCLSWEDVLCGAGLETLYRAHRALAGESGFLSDKDITAEALNQRGVARQTLLHFCALLGRAASNAALTLGAQGGVYITGGIIPRFPLFFAQSDFRRTFEQNNRMADYLKAIPTYLVTAEHPGLIGACQALNNPLVPALNTAP